MSDDSLSPKEAERRAAAALKKMLATPPKPHAAMKGKTKPSPAGRKAEKAK
jgi:hypothetical protein